MNVERFRRPGHDEYRQDFRYPCGRRVRKSIDQRIVYSVFTDNLSTPDHYDIWVTRSLDKGATWSQPVKVNSDKGTHFFPWIAAGSTGQVEFMWLNLPDYNAYRRGAVALVRDLRSNS